jgi:hypothetical protein
MAERRKYTLTDALESVELDKHWKQVFESGQAPDILISMEAKFQEAAKNYMALHDELRNWARQDIAMAREAGRRR